MLYMDQNCVEFLSEAIAPNVTTVANISNIYNNKSFSISFTWKYKVYEQKKESAE